MVWKHFNMNSEIDGEIEGTKQREKAQENVDYTRVFWIEKILVTHSMQKFALSFERWRGHSDLITGKTNFYQHFVRFFQELCRQFFSDITINRYKAVNHSSYFSWFSPLTSMHLSETKQKNVNLLKICKSIVFHPAWFVNLQPNEWWWGVRTWDWKPMRMYVKMNKFCK